METVALICCFLFRQNVVAVQNVATTRFFVDDFRKVRTYRAGDIATPQKYVLW